MTRPASALLYQGAEWDFDMIARVYGAEADVALGELGLQPFEARIEVIQAEQMLDAYASSGMPLLYRHWSFGKRFAQNEMLYRKGWQSLAYEIVINSDPCIVYIMEENTATMQATVLAHAAFGHSHFFRSNYLFRQWTRPQEIIPYLEYAKRFVSQCEERFGVAAVERLIDAAHTLMNHGVDRVPKKHPIDARTAETRERDRARYLETVFRDIWRTVPTSRRAGRVRSADQRRALLGLPEENILRFIERTAPRLQNWQREILAIVQGVAQYFYPQRQTKLMNEGCATFVHHRVMTRLHERGLIDDGAYLEFLRSHSNVVAQPDFDDRSFGGINPYALGFAMMTDIERMCSRPTAEDIVFAPGLAGRNPYETLSDIWANYRDESFVAQYLSPALIRRLRLFLLRDEEKADSLVVEAIHDERGEDELRRALARAYDVSRHDLNLAVADADLAGDRVLELEHSVVDGVLLEGDEAEDVLVKIADLWGYPVRLRELDGDRLCGEHSAEPKRPFH